MAFATYADFIRYLEKVGELHRVKTDVDPCLEITEIAQRALREKKPALLFENVKGSKYPLVINAMASDHRCELALGKHPQQLGEELLRFLEDLFPPSLSSFSRHTSLIRRFMSASTRSAVTAISQQVAEEPDLDELPILTCWPEDGGRFITLPQVITHDPSSGKRNMGMYRMHVFDRQTTGMHWQIQKGGGFHYFQSEKRGRPLELAVALGTDPALLLATIAPLPENLDEAVFAGFLRGKRSAFVKGVSISIRVPANAEFILEGVVPVGERRMEGPFGDHFGHYSQAAEYPVFHLRKITHRKDPIYPATVVGIPPMEDKFLGDTTQYILGPLARVIHSEITDMWAYYEAGFHNLLVVAVEQRYAKESMKTALGLMGMSQLSLTKCIILVSESVNVRDFGVVMKEVRDNFDPHFDFVMIPRVPLDTLDFTSFTMNLGSKMILDATRKQRPAETQRGAISIERLADQLNHLKMIDHRISDLNLVHESLLLVKVVGQGMPVLEKLVKHTELSGIRLIAVVSDDVDIRDKESYIWGIFTRFDCERDITFTEQRVMGISLIYKGIMGIDATWKEGYPKPLRMVEGVQKRVEERWDTYWK